MAKDPAFLFYSSDFMSGTSLMSNEQVGQYIKLLCLQHQTGRLKEKDIKKITEDEDVISKFIKDEKGLYYNARLDVEINRRKSYSESRRKNRQPKHISSTHDNHMSNISDTYVEHMETGTETIIESKGGEGGKENILPKPPIADIKHNIPEDVLNYQAPPKPPTMQQAEEFFYHAGFKNKKDAKDFWNYYNGLGWRIGSSPIVQWTSIANKWMGNIRVENNSPPPASIHKNAKELLDELNKNKK